MRLLLPLLLQDGSRLLHRHLLSFVRRLPPREQAAAGRVITGALLAAARQQLDTAGAGPDAGTAGGASWGGTASADLPSWVRPSLSLAQAGASLTWQPASRAWLAPAAAPLLRLSARAAGALLAAADAGSPLSPHSVDQLQEAVTLIIYLLVNYGAELAANSPPFPAETSTAPHLGPAAHGGRGGAAPQLSGLPEGQLAVLEAAEAMLAALRSQSLVRELVSSAAVALWHASVLPAVPPASAALAFARGLGLDGGEGLDQDRQQQEQQQEQQQQQHVVRRGLMANPQLDAVWSEASLVERLLSARAAVGDDEAKTTPTAAHATHGSCLVAALARVSPLGRVCALKGLVTALPVEALCVSLESASVEGGSGWSLLAAGAVPTAAAALGAATDSHAKFHSANTLGAAMARCREVWQQLAAQGEQGASVGEAVAAKEDQAGDGEGGSGGGGGGGALLVPWLLPETREQVMAALWPMVDEPVAQTLKQVGAAAGAAACRVRMGGSTVIQTLA
jgi:hypothetical protein